MYHTQNGQCGEIILIYFYIISIYHDIFVDSRVLTAGVNR